MALHYVEFDPASYFDDWYEGQDPVLVERLSLDALWDLFDRWVAEQYRLAQEWR